MTLTKTPEEPCALMPSATIDAHADELTRLDQAIGDGDHGLNMQRGFKAVLPKPKTKSPPCPSAKPCRRPA